MTQVSYCRCSLPIKGCMIHSNFHFSDPGVGVGVSRANFSPYLINTPNKQRGSVWLLHTIQCPTNQTNQQSWAFNWSGMGKNEEDWHWRTFHASNQEKFWFFFAKKKWKNCHDFGQPWWSIRVRAEISFKMPICCYKQLSWEASGNPAHSQNKLAVVKSKQTPRVDRFALK